MRVQGSGVPQEDISQLISTMEAKYEAKLAEIKRNLAFVEKERTESEADWSRKLCEKSRETDELRMILQSSAKMREEKESTIGLLKSEIEKLTAEVQNHQRQALELQLQVDRMNDAEVWLTDYALQRYLTKVLYRHRSSFASQMRKLKLRVTEVNLKT